MGQRLMLAGPRCRLRELFDLCLLCASTRPQLSPSTLLITTHISSVTPSPTRELQKLNLRQLSRGAWKSRCDREVRLLEGILANHLSLQMLNYLLRLRCRGCEAELNYPKEKGGNSG